MRTPTILIAAIATLALAGCGGDDDTDSAASEEANTFATTTPDESFAVAADPSALAYTETDLSVPAGSITVDFENPASTPHDVVVEDADGNELMRTEEISESSATATAELEPGTYTFYCSVDGHRDAGMEGTLTVE
jgi:plastocyanin